MGMVTIPLKYSNVGTTENFSSKRTLTLKRSLRMLRNVKIFCNVAIRLMLLNVVSINKQPIVILVKIKASLRTGGMLDRSRENL